MNIRTISILCSVLLLACGGPETHPPAGTSYSNVDPNPATPCDGGTAQAGEPCASDCDCCGRACATYTDDAGSSRVCAGSCETP